MTKRSLTLAFAALMATSTLAACGGGSESTVAADCKPVHPDIKTIDEGTLSVIGYDLPPFATMGKDEVTGVDGDILKEILAMECLELKVTSAAAAAVIPTVQAGRADLAVTDWYRTAERAAIVDLSDPIYTDQMGIISADGISAIPDLKGKRVGTVDGYLWVADLKEYLGDDMKTYAAPVNMYQDMKAGRLDVIVDSFGSGVYNADGAQVKVADALPEVAASTEPAQTTFPVPKGSDTLLKAINEDIATLRENGRLAEIMTANGLDASAADPGAPRLIQ